MRALILLILAAVHLTFAFKITSHVATANDVMDELFKSDKSQSVDKLVFQSGNQSITIKVSYSEAYEAIKKYPKFFRGGVVGPDGFPDAINGQIYEHSNESSVGKSIARFAANGSVSIGDKEDLEPMESRSWPSQLRSIDWAMKLYQHWVNYPSFVENNLINERQQALSFIMGYLSHCIGDAFMHTWVNEKAHGAWEYLEGEGIYGPLSEEIKHVAIEGYADYQIPKDRFSTNHEALILEYDRTDLRAPVKFLDSFYGSDANLPVNFGDKNADNFDDYFDYYKIPERYYGGAIYSLLSAQHDLADAILNWTKMEGLVRITSDGIPGDDWILHLLDIADWPNQQAEKLKELVKGDFLTFITNGYVDCSSETSLTDFQKAELFYRYITGFRERIEDYKEKARITKLNWMVMSECSARNFAQLSAPNYDRSHPDKNRDFCSKYAENAENGIWADTHGEGLYRGSVTDQEFLNGIVGSFKTDTSMVFIDTTGIGEDDGATFEQKNQHRSFVANINRQLGYGLSSGVFVDEIFHVIFPQDQSGEESSTWDKMCSHFRNNGKKNCTKTGLFPLAWAYEEGQCLTNHASCVVTNTKACSQKLCELSCASSGVGAFTSCGKLCDAGANLAYDACKAVVSDVCTISVCLLWRPTFNEYGLPNGRKCVIRGSQDIKYCKPTLNPVCDAAKPTDAKCDIPGLCGVKATICSYESVQNSWDDLGIIDEIHEKISSTCDAVDRAKENWESYDTPIERLNFLKRQGIPVDDFIRWKNRLGSIKDQLREHPPELIVNIAFLEEDLLDDNYKSDVQNRMNDFDAVTETETDDAVVETRNWFSSTFDKIINKDPNPFGTTEKEVNENSTKFVEFIIRHNVLLGLKGGTAQQASAEFGPNFTETFAPYYNTRQGMKLVGLANKATIENPVGDINRAFDDNGVSKDYLPWGLEPNVRESYSSICKSDYFNQTIYCDVLKSNDDPYCIDCNEESIVENGFNWTPGKGVVLWNKYDPTGKTKTNTLSNFVFASTQDAYDKFYKNIFRVPQSMPEGFGFDGKPKDFWTSNEVSLTYDDALKTEGNSSLQICEEGWFSLKSMRFNTTDLQVFSREISIDVYVPMGQSNPNWLGNVSMVMKIPAAGVWYSYLGQEQLSSLQAGQWHTLTFNIPEEGYQAIQGDFANMTIEIKANINSSSAGCFHMDNLRFTGEIQHRSVFHQVGAQGVNVGSTGVMTFDEPSHWSLELNANKFKEVNIVEEGSASTAIDINGWNSMVSDPFNTSQLEKISKEVNLSLFIPKPQPNEWWVGNVSLHLKCGQSGGFQYVGQQDLAWAFQGEYNSIQYNLSDYLFNELKKNQQCQWKINLSLNNKAGQFYFDNMGFIDATENNQVIIDSSGNQNAFLCGDADCQNAEVVNAGASTVLNQYSGKWYSVSSNILGWQANQLGGRVIQVNGVEVFAGGSLNHITPLNGKYYFYFGEGTNSATEWSYW